MVEISEEERLRRKTNRDRELHIEGVLNRMALEEEEDLEKAANIVHEAFKL